MKAASHFHSTQNPILQDLCGLWLAVFASLIYLEVPLKHAPLFATALALQAVFGSELISKLLVSTPPSLALLCGPGLILGGALSFLIFQVAGRGIVGVFAASIAAAWAWSAFVKRRNLHGNVGPRWLLFGQILGLSALAMSSEFRWLLVAGVGCLLPSIVTQLRFAVRRNIMFRSGSLLVAFAFLGLAARLRQGSWWVITDDYLFFETLKNHLSSSSLLSDWGSVSFARYHWLSYGWAAFLDYFAMRPETLVTLTRVMPLVYSMALASSLLLILNSLVSALRPASVSPARTPSQWWLGACVVLGCIRIDWGGLSTAASVSVVAAALSILILVINEDSPFAKRALLYIVIGSLICLTKLTSLILFPALLIGSEVTLLTKRFPRISQTIAIPTAVSLGSAMTLGILPFLSSASGGVFSLDWSPLQANSVSSNGLLPAVARVASTRLVGLLLIVIALTLFLCSNRSDSRKSSFIFLLSTSSLWISGVLTETLVVGRANTSDYFSAPNYFVSAASSMLVIIFMTEMQQGHRSIRLQTWVWMALFAVASWLISDDLPVFLSLTDSLSQSRSIFMLTVLGLLLLAWILRNRYHLDQVSRLPVYLILTVASLVGVNPTFQKLITDQKLPNDDIWMLGPPDAERVGKWLRVNSEQDDLIATNYLTSPQGGLRSDYSLAAWARREFLVLGPSLSFSDDTDSTIIANSVEFGVDPAEQSNFLRTYGVLWYVVDLEATYLRSWEPYAETVFRTRRFWLLRIR